MKIIRGFGELTHSARLTYVLAFALMANFFYATRAHALFDPDLNFSLDASYPYTAAVNLNATTISSATIVYSVNPGDSSLCVVAGNTLFILSGVGTCTIFATVAAEGSFDGDTVQVQIALTKADPNLQFTLTDQVEGETFNLSSTSNGSGMTTYSSDTPSICTVSADTATAISAGTCTITASKAADSNYFSDAKQESITILAPTATATPTFTNTATNTATATPSNTPTETPTQTHTATSTPTNTATSTATHTQTYTPSSTATSTFTSTATQTPESFTPTPTATVVFTATGTLTPVNTPTIAPTVSTTELKGIILDANGKPVAGVVVYLYKLGGNPDAPDGLQIKAEKENGTSSTITNAQGEYTFTEVSAGTYRIIPDNIGYIFEPSQVSTGNGSYAAPIQARPSDLNDEGCDRKDLSAKITGSDQKASELMEFALDKVSQFKKKSKKELSSDNSAKLNRSLSGAAEDLRSVFTNILNQSRSLPKIELRCSERPDCREVSFKRAVKKYADKIEQLKRLSLFVLRKSNDAFGDIQSEELDRKVRRLYKASRNAGRFLPKKTFSCL